MNFPQMDGVFLKVIFLQFSLCEKDSVVIIISLKKVRRNEELRAVVMVHGPYRRHQMD